MPLGVESDGVEEDVEEEVSRTRRRVVMGWGCGGGDMSGDQEVVV